MDALIALFIIIGLVNVLGSSRRKREQEAKEAQRRAFREAEQARQASEPLPPSQRAQARRAKREAVEARLAHTPEELQAHLAGMEARGSGASWPNAGGNIPLEVAARTNEPKPAEPRVAATRSSEPKPAEPKVVAPHRPHDGEGTISTQGESAEEHAEHLRRAAAEEQARRLARETLRDLRSARREKLQSAVVMSEILNKPVSLRPRAGLHR